MAEIDTMSKPLSASPSAAKKPSRRPRSTGAKGAVQELVAHLEAAIEAITEHQVMGPRETFTLQPLNPLRIVLAFSGGRDSTVLLDALARLKKRARQSRIADITAVHVHHGLSSNADAWCEHAKTQCAKRGIECVIERVWLNPRQTGIEAAARQARYRVLMRVARERGADVVMTAHHQDDQIETFLIQWMRGAGPEGLSAMSAVRPIEQAWSGGWRTGDVLLSRPWLDVSGEKIAAYAAKARLTWVEDESNSDTRFLRNLLRNTVLPELDKARSGWRTAAARSIALVAQAAGVLNNVGHDDAVACLAEDGKGLVIGKLLALPLERQALCLRSWLARNELRAPSQVKTLDILRQLRQTSADTRLVFRVDGKELRRWANKLVVAEPARSNRTSIFDMPLTWKGEGELSLGVWGGVLRFVACGPDEDGIDAALLKEGPLSVRARKGGEKIKLHPLRPSRNLKHLYQAAGVAPFERGDLPLVWLADKLIYAAGLGMEVRMKADRVLVPERVRLEWVPDRELLSFADTVKDA